MNRDQLSNFNPNDLSKSAPSNLGSHFQSGAFFVEPSAAAAKFSARQQALDRILKKIFEQNLLAKSYVEQYLRHKYRRNCKANTLRQAALSLVQFLSFFANRGNRVLEQLSREDIEAFVEDMQDRGLKPTTVNTRLRNVYAFVRYLIIEYRSFDWGLMERKVKLKMPDRLPRAIDPQHLDQLLAAIDNCRDRALILLLLRSGMRIGELLNCQLEDIDLTEQKIFIYESDKTSVGRVVYYSADAQQALLAWLQVRDPYRQYLFYGHKDKPLSYEAARCIFKKCLPKAGLQYSSYSLHCLRHSFATDLLNATMPLECLRELLGHCSMEITRRYARLSDKTREEEYFKAMQRILKGECNENDQCDR